MAREYRKESEYAGGEDRVKQDVKKKAPGSLYVFFGEESYLKQYYLSQLRSILVSGPSEEFNYHRFPRESFDASEFASAVSAYPAFAERTMVLVEDYNPFKASEGERELVTETLSDLPDYCCVILYYEITPFSPDKRMKKLWEVIKDKATIVEFTKRSDSELIPWTIRHFKAFGKTIDDRLCRELIFATGGFMTPLAAEIEKIAAYSDGNEIRPSDVKAVVEPVMEAVVFDATDAMAQGDFGKALRLVQSLVKKQEDPIQILGAIGAFFRRAYAAKVLVSRGEGVNALCELYGIKPFAAQKTVTIAAKLSDSFCRKAVLLCEETDYKMKSSFDNSSGLLELLLVDLAEEYRNA